MKLQYFLPFALSPAAFAQEMTTQEHFNAACGSYSHYNNKIIKVNGHEFKVNCRHAVQGYQGNGQSNVPTAQVCAQICTSVTDCLGSLWRNDGQCWVQEEDLGTPYFTAHTGKFMVLQRVNTVEEYEKKWEDCENGSGVTPPVGGPAVPFSFH